MTKLQLQARGISCWTVSVLRAAMTGYARSGASRNRNGGWVQAKGEMSSWIAAKWKKISPRKLPLRRIRWSPGKYQPLNLTFSESILQWPLRPHEQELPPSFIMSLTKSSWVYSAGTWLMRLKPSTSLPISTAAIFSTNFAVSYSQLSFSLRRLLRFSKIKLAKLSLPEAFPRRWGADERTHTGPGCKISHVKAGITP